MQNGDYLFGRYARVTFTNLDTGVVTEIDSQLRIEFEYLKSIDESEATSVGKIVIHGLTRETFNNLGDRHRCAVELTVGYTQSKTAEPQSIFTAALKNKSFKAKRGGSVSEFDVDGNFYYLVAGEKYVQSYPDGIELQQAIIDIANFMGLGISVKLPKNSNNIIEFFQNYKIPFGYSLNGTPKEALDQICNSFDMEYTIQNKILVMSIRERSIERWRTQADRFVSDKPLRFNDVIPSDSKIKVSGGKDIVAGTNSKNIVERTENIVFVLSFASGLIDTPFFETIEAKKAYDEALQIGETIENREEQKVKKGNDGSPKTDGDGNIKLTKKPTTMKISRKTLKVECLINPSIQPQSQIELSVDEKTLDGIYRVRDIVYKGDTRGNGKGSWSMQMNLNEVK